MMIDYTEFWGNRTPMEDNSYWNVYMKLYVARGRARAVKKAEREARAAKRNGDPAHDAKNRKEKHPGFCGECYNRTEGGHVCQNCYLPDEPTGFSLDPGAVDSPGHEPPVGIPFTKSHSSKNFSAHGPGSPRKKKAPPVEEKARYKPVGLWDFTFGEPAPEIAQSPPPPVAPAAEEPAPSSEGTPETAPPAKAVSAPSNEVCKVFNHGWCGIEGKINTCGGLVERCIVEGGPEGGVRAAKSRSERKAKSPAIPKKNESVSDAKISRKARAKKQGVAKSPNENVGNTEK